MNDGILEPVCLAGTRRPDRLGYVMLNPYTDANKLSSHL